jgi:hypothetical protein
MNDRAIADLYSAWKDASGFSAPKKANGLAGSVVHGCTSPSASSSQSASNLFCDWHPPQ